MTIQPDSDRPLLAEELAQLPDQPATEKPPDEVVSLLAERRIHVAAADDVDLGAVLGEAESVDDGWQLRLPPGASLARPGRTGGRLDREKQDLPELAQIEPERPAWVSMSYQPRTVDQFAARPPMRSVSGNRLEPYYGVFGFDDREVFYPNTYPWGCIGSLYTWTATPGTGPYVYAGSGVLVGPRHVLTAGHLCPWNSTSWAMLFEAGYWNGSPVSGPGGRSWVSEYQGWNTNMTVAAHDVAVLRLYDPVGSALGSMGAKVYQTSWDGQPLWTLAGYAGDVAAGQRPSFESRIQVARTDEDGDARELKHWGDASSGDSGGPFFGFWGTSPYVVGVTSGGESASSGGTVVEDFNVEAGGRYMVDLVNWARTNWT